MQCIDRCKGGEEGRDKNTKRKNQEKKCQPRGRLPQTGARGLFFFLLVVRISLHSNAASPRCLSVSLSDTNFTIRQHSAREAVSAWGEGAFSCLVGPAKAGDIACGRTDLSLVALLGPWCLWGYMISCTRPLLLRVCPYCIPLPVLLRQNAVRGRGVGVVVLPLVLPSGWTSESPVLSHHHGYAHTYNIENRNCTAAALLS